MFDLGSRSLLLFTLSLGQFHLNTVDTVDTVNEEDKNEDERNLSRCEHSAHHWGLCEEAYLHAILHSRYDGAVGYEGKKLALHGVWKGDDEQPEDAHLEHQECEHLEIMVVSAGERLQ